MAVDSIYGAIYPRRVTLTLKILNLEFIQNSILWHIKSILWDHDACNIEFHRALQKMGVAERTFLEI
jgi:hypothetical protein